MPARHRASGGMCVMSLPSRMMRPESGRTIPVIRLNRLDLPAPFGPMTPSASPDDKVRSMSLATTIAPNAFDMALSSSIVIARYHRESAQGLHVTAKRNLRCLLVLGNHHVVFVAGQPPLAAHKRRLCDVPCGERRHLVGAEGNKTNDGIKLGRADGLGQRGAVRRVARSFHGIDRNFKQRMDETNWLGPLPAGCLLVAFGEVGSADAAQARFVGMAGRPPHLGRNVVAALAERMNGFRE